MECTNILQIIAYGYKKKLRKCDVLKFLKIHDFLTITSLYIVGSKYVLDLQ